MDDSTTKPDASYAEYLSKLLSTYGTSVLSESYGGRWKEDIPNDVRNILFHEKPYELMEIVLRPEDPEGHHWRVEHYLLIPDEEGKLVRAAAVEAKSALHKKR